MKEKWEQTKRWAWCEDNMKESICIYLDEELNNLVNEKSKRNGFNIDEFVNTSLKEKFNIVED